MNCKDCKHWKVAGIWDNYRVPADGEEEFRTGSCLIKLGDRVEIMVEYDVVRSVDVDALFGCVEFEAKESPDE